MKRKRKGEESPSLPPKAKTKQAKRRRKEEEEKATFDKNDDMPMP